MALTKSYYPNYNTAAQVAAQTRRQLITLASTITILSIVAYFAQLSLSSAYHCNRFKPGERPRPPLMYQELNGRYTYTSNPSQLNKNLLRPYAACVSGHKVEDMLKPNVYESIMQHLVNGNDTDLFVFAYYDNRPGSQFDIEHFATIYRDHLMAFIIQPWTEEHYRETETFDIYHDMTRPQLGYVAMLSGIQTCHHSLLRPHVVNVRSGREYSVVMRTRPDVIYETPVRLEDRVIIPTTAFAIVTPPSHNSWKPADPVGQRSEDGFLVWKDQGGALGINDEIFMGGPLIMDVLTSVLYGWMRSGDCQKHVPSICFHTYGLKLQLKVDRADFKYSLLHPLIPSNSTLRP